MERFCMFNCRFQQVLVLWMTTVYKWDKVLDLILFRTTFLCPRGGGNNIITFLWRHLFICITSYLKKIHNLRRIHPFLKPAQLWWLWSWCGYLYFQKSWAKTSKIPNLNSILLSQKANKTVPTDQQGHFGWIKKRFNRYVQTMGSKLKTV